MAKAKLDKDVVRAEFLSGDGLGTIAKRYGVDKSSVRGCLRRQGIDTSKRATSKTSHEVEQSVIALYREYYSCEKVADSVGLCSATVTAILERNGIARRKPKKETRKAKPRGNSNCKTKYCASLVVMLRTVLDLSFSELVKITDIPGNSVSNIIRKRGLVAPKPKQSLTKKEIDLILADYQSGNSTYEIGEKYGINHSRVCKIANSHGLRRGRGKGKAFERSRKKQHEEAVARWKAEFGENLEATGKYARCARRSIRKHNRKRDNGITWRTLAERNGSMRCEVCGVECDPNDKSWGSHGATHPSVDHITRLVDGGTDTWDNVRLVCCACNFELNAKAMRGVNYAEEQTA